MLNNDNEVIVVSADSKSNSVASYVKAKLNYQKIDVKGLKKGKFILFLLNQTILICITAVG